MPLPGLSFMSMLRVQAPDANTLLYLGMGGANGSTTFTDSSSSARTVSVFGNAQISHSNVLYGNGSLLCDGSGDYISVPDSADWNFGANNFTIDFWMKSSTDRQICGQGYFTSGADFQLSIIINMNGSGGLRIQGGSAPQNASLDFNTTSTDYFDGNWHHVALVRNGTTFTIYKDGIADGSQTIAITLMNSGETFKIGRAHTTASDYTGNITKFRIRNVAVWTSNFSTSNWVYHV